jgi:hypothetical protein
MGIGSQIVTHVVTRFVLKKCNIRPAEWWVFAITDVHCIASKINNSLTRAELLLKSGYSAIQEVPRALWDL